MVASPPWGCFTHAISAEVVAGAPSFSCRQTMDAARRVERPEAAEPVAEENVFLFVPNLIGTLHMFPTDTGYARVILAAISLYYMRDNPKMCTALYVVSCLLDAFDGYFARKLNQSTRFGAVLDMVTDRCTTACLICFLTAAYPSYAIVFQALVTLDFSSHYIHMYSSLVSGATSHKKVNSKQSRILSLYYTDTRTLFVFCACNELFFLCLYLMDFYKQPLGLDLASFLPRALEASILRSKNNWLFYIVYQVVPHLTWPHLLCAITFPVFAGKQIINGVQFWKAAKALVNMDLAERRARCASLK